MLSHLATDCSLLLATFQDLRFAVIFTFSSKIYMIKNIHLNRILCLKISIVKKGKSKFVLVHAMRAYSRLYSDIKLPIL
jgi:hypothetical protein